MLPIPSLTDEELASLRESIRRDGVQYPVLLDRSGQVIDGHHRKKIAAELGVDCPSRTLDADPDTAERLSATLNLARRHLTTAQRYELIAWLDSRHRTEAEAEGLDRKVAGTRIDLGTSEVPRSKRQPRSTEEIARRINADLADMGETMTVNGSTVTRARIWAEAPESEKAAVRAGRKSVTEIAQPGHKEAQRRSARRLAPRTSRKAERRQVTPRAHIDSQAEIRAVHAETQYQSMYNAPTGKLNLPLLRRLEQIQEYLDDIYELPPDKAVLAFPVNRCREFSTSRAEWWRDFTELCDKRWRDEAPDLPEPRTNHRLIPLAERDLTQGDRLMLDWLRTKTEPVTAVEAAVALRISNNGAMNNLARLVGSGLADMVGLLGRRKTYRAAMTA